DEFSGFDAQVGGFAHQRDEVGIGEVVAAALSQPRDGAGGHEHAHSAPFDQHAGIGEQVQPLAGGGGVDPQEGGQLVGGGHRGALRVGAVEDPVLDLLRDGDVERLRLVEHSSPPVVGRCRGSLVHYSTNEP